MYTLGAHNNELLSRASTGSVAHLISVCVAEENELKETVVVTPTYRHASKVKLEPCDPE